MSDGDITVLKLVYCISLVKLASLGRIAEKFEGLFEHSKTNTLLARLLKLLTMLFIIAHVVACIWIWYVKLNARSFN